MDTRISVASKFSLEDYIRLDGLSPEMLDAILNFFLTLRTSETTKELYLQRLRKFGLWLMDQGFRTFTVTQKADIDRFLVTYDKNNTRNGYITTLRLFYRDFLKKPEVVRDLKYYREKLEPITPSDVLTPEEVIQIAEEAGKRRDMYKVIILTLFESCARVSELLHLRLGDVRFRSVTDKDGHRKITATLHFKRSKGSVPKQPVTLIMFASELKRYVNNHSGDGQSWLFPSPYKPEKPIGRDAIDYALWNAGSKLGIRKRLNPHWFRHSGLSFFSNNKNYNEQLLMWRAGWTSTTMARRYIHSGAELEAKAYLERMGFQLEQGEETTIGSRVCPHCGATNPYTNNNCDCCGMPLDLEEYKAEIEKRRNVERYYKSLEKIYTGKLSEKQKAELSHCTSSIVQLIELGRDDLATQYLEKLLETWVKVFLTT